MSKNVVGIQRKLTQSRAAGKPALPEYRTHWWNYMPYNREMAYSDLHIVHYMLYEAYSELYALLYAAQFSPLRCELRCEYYPNVQV